MIGVQCIGCCEYDDSKKECTRRSNNYPYEKGICWMAKGEGEY